MRQLLVTFFFLVFILKRDNDSSVSEISSNKFPLNKFNKNKNGVFLTFKHKLKISIVLLVASMRTLSISFEFFGSVFNSLNTLFSAKVFSCRCRNKQQFFFQFSCLKKCSISSVFDFYCALFFQMCSQFELSFWFFLW